jgi:23S rRNA (cytosine1962-C5)-methyltransferase
VDPHIRQLEQLPARESQLIHGERSSTSFTLNAVRFHFDTLGGQKTGAFLDQRENYAAAARYAHGESLDCFTYQGGFALHLARACSKVTAVDSSRPALEVAEQNEQLNRATHICGEIEWVEANAFDLLKDYSTAGHQYDTIVLDPPAFAKTKRVVDTAIRGYKELNLRALKMLRVGGVLVTCSCSFHVNEGEFLEMLGSAAADAGRRLRILEKRGAALDHPVLANVPETAYLKCIICQVIE